MAFTPGTYEGIGRGYRGKLPVSVTVSEDKIEAVVVGKHKEVRGIAWGLNTTPIELYPQWIVEYQSLNIPSIPSLPNPPPCGLHDGSSCPTSCPHPFAKE